MVGIGRLLLPMFEMRITVARALFKRLLYNFITIIYCLFCNGKIEI